MAPVKRSARYLARADSTPSYKPATGKLTLADQRTKPRAIDRMNQYLPWLLIIAGVLALAAAVIYWRMSYVVSD
jgi:hypothetical protein